MERRGWFPPITFRKKEAVKKSKVFIMITITKGESHEDESGAELLLVVAMVPQQVSPASVCVEDSEIAKSVGNGGVVEGQGRLILLNAPIGCGFGGDGVTPDNGVHNDGVVVPVSDQVASIRLYAEVLARIHVGGEHGTALVPHWGTRGVGESGVGNFPTDDVSRVSSIFHRAVLLHAGVRAIDVLGRVHVGHGVEEDCL